MPAVLERYTPNVSKVELVEASLIDHLHHLRFNWQREGLPSNWADLPGTGFQIHTQLNLLLKENMSTWLLQTEEDIKGFILEYLAEGLVFPIFYKKEGGTIVAPLYGGKDIEDLVSEQERNGAVKRSVRRIKSFFLDEKTPDGALAVMTSPAGWSGLKDGEGRKIVFPDSQTYIFQKREDDIVGFTIRTDFSLAEHRELLKRLHMRDVLSDKSVVSEYVEQVAAILPVQREFEISDLVDTMKNIRGTDFAYQKRTWDEVYRDLERREELWQFDKKTKNYVSEFKDYILSSSISRAEIKEALAATILRIARFLRGEKRSKSHATETHSYKPISYGGILKEVQELPGCAGGGTSSLVNSLTPRQTETAVGTIRCVTCPFCNKTVDAILTKDKIICPECNQSANRK